MKRSTLFFVHLFVIIECYAQNVGIGTTIPAHKLDVVNGSINTDRDYKLAGTTIIKIHGTSNLVLGHLSGLGLAGGTDNTFCGYQAGHFVTLGSDNSFFGSGSGYFNGSGFGNSFFGAYSGYLNTGNSNSFFGTSAGTNNTTGFENTFSGNGTGFSNTTGKRNTTNGFRTLYNGNDSDNTAIGHKALYANTSGSENSATGSSAMLANTTGDENTAIGVQAMILNTTGSSNTALGYQALKLTSTGDFNTSIGSYSHANNGDYSNSTMLGSNAHSTASNQVRVGSGLTSTIGGYVDWTTFSDGRFKKNIELNVPGLAFIQKLNPVTYTLDLHAVEDFLFPNGSRYADVDGKEKEKLAAYMEKGMDAKEKITYTGFIAQEVEESARQLGFNFSGVDVPQNDKDLYGLRYAEFVVPLVKAVQEQQSMIENQKLEITQLKLKNVKIEQQDLIITKQQKTIEELLTRIQKVEIQLQSKR